MWNLFGKPAPIADEQTPTPEEQTPTPEEQIPTLDHGDAYYFNDIGVICEPYPELPSGFWTIRIIPPLDPPPSLQKDLYDAKCGAIKLTNPLGETGWQPTIGRIELWGTDVQYRHDGHTSTIRPFFGEADIPSDAIRYSCWSEERAIEEAEEMKQRLIGKYEERLRTQWAPGE